MRRPVVVRSLLALVFVGGVALPAIAHANPAPLPVPGVTAPAIVTSTVTTVVQTDAPTLVTLVTGGAAKVVTNAAGTVTTVVSTVPVPPAAQPLVSAAVAAATGAPATVKKLTGSTTVSAPTGTPAVVPNDTKPTDGNPTTTQDQPQTQAQSQSKAAAVSDRAAVVTPQDDPPKPPTLFDLLSAEQATEPATTDASAPSTSATSSNLAQTGLGLGAPILGVIVVAAGAIVRRRAQSV